MTISVDELRKMVKLLEDNDVKPMEEGPTRWWIDENEDGWMISFDGPVSGSMHPKTFCEIMVDSLNKGEK